MNSKSAAERFNDLACMIERTEHVDEITAWIRAKRRYPQLSELAHADIEKEEAMKRQQKKPELEIHDVIA